MTALYNNEPCTVCTQRSPLIQSYYFEQGLIWSRASVSGTLSTQNAMRLLLLHSIPRQQEDVFAQQVVSLPSDSQERVRVIKDDMTEVSSSSPSSSSSLLQLSVSCNNSDTFRRSSDRLNSPSRRICSPIAISSNSSSVISTALAASRAGSVEDLEPSDLGSPSSEIVLAVDANEHSSSCVVLFLLRDRCLRQGDKLIKGFFFLLKYEPSAGTKVHSIACSTKMGLSRSKWRCRANDPAVDIGARLLLCSSSLQLLSRDENDIDGDGLGGKWKEESISRMAILWGLAALPSAKVRSVL